MRLHPILAVAAVALLAGCSSSTSAGTSSDAGSGGGGGQPSGNGPSRSNLSCSSIGTGEASLTPGATFTAGSWGSIPTALQQLPSGGTLCGTTSGGDAGAQDQLTQISTNLWDQQIFSFYNPILQGMGCSLQPMQTGASPAHSLTSFQCKNGAYGSIIASGSYDYLDINYVP